MWESVQLWLYRVEGIADRLVEAQLTHLSLTSAAVVFGAGVVTSLSPCMLSMLPIAVGYIGGYSEDRQRWQATVQSLWFALGLSITLTGLGLSAALLGRVYGQVGHWWPLLMGGVAIAMGLNLLEILPIQFPNWLADKEIPQHLPGTMRSLLLGLTFGLIASPCSTPVLVALLGWVSTSGNLTVGGGLLFAYALGLVSPLVVAGTFTGLIKQLLAVRRWSRWLTYGSGALLVAFGTISLATQLV
ncbi:MAG: cytochrome c biogenesis protein CcdA [Synechococcus sp.]